MIYARVDKEFGDRADPGKITGMLLEMENSELIILIQDEEHLRSKAAEAILVYQESRQ